MSPGRRQEFEDRCPPERRAYNQAKDSRHYILGVHPLARRSKCEGAQGREATEGLRGDLPQVAEDPRRPEVDCQDVMMMMMLFIGTHSVTTTLNVHSRSRSFVIAIDLRGLAPSMRLFRRPNTNSMKK